MKPALLLFATYLVACTFPACRSEPSSRPTTPAAQVTSSAEPVPTNRLPSDLKPHHYDLALTILPERERFSGKVEIAVELSRARDRIWLHGNDLHVHRAEVALQDGEILTAVYSQVSEDGVARLDLPLEIGPQKGEPRTSATLRLAFDAPFDRRLEGLYRVEEGGRSYAFSHFEPISARRCFPGFDEPAFKTTFDITLNIKRGHRAIANTLPIKEEDLPGGLMRIHFARTAKLPTYLLAFAVGPLEVVEADAIPPNEIRLNPIPFRGAAVQGKGGKLAYALAHTPSILETLEGYFGIPYPFSKLDIIAVPDFEAGAMENAGAVFFREWLLLLDEKNLPQDQQRAFAYVMAHELAHMWFGNLVTLRWWDDLWLNEAFATWMGHRAVQEWRPDHHALMSMLRRVHRAMDADSLTSARQIRQPIETSHDIHNAFDSITYSKGGGVLAMFERWLGPEVFRHGIRHYLETYRFGNATVDDLLDALSKGAHRDVATPFRTFLFQPGVPLVEVKVVCRDESGGSGGEKESRRAWTSTSLTQSRYLPVGSTGERERTWQIPVCMRYQADGRIYESCSLLTKKKSSGIRLGWSCPDWIFPNADGAGYYRWALPPEEMGKLRRSGMQHLSTRERLSLADSLKAALASASLPAADVLAALLPLAGDDNRLVAVSPMETLRFARDHLLPRELAPRVEELGRRLYGPVLARLSKDEGRLPSKKGKGAHQAEGARRENGEEDGERALLRAEVSSFLAFVARDPDLRQELTKRGHSYVGWQAAGEGGREPIDGGRGREPIDGKVHPETVDVDLAATALAVAVQESDAAFFYALVDLLGRSQDALLRGQILGALGRTTDPLLGRKARNLILQPLLRANEVFILLNAHLAEKENHEAAWAWLKENVDALLKRLPTSHGGWLPWIGARFCSEVKAREVEGFFAPLVEELPGGPRNLKGSVEAIRLCAARVQAQRESARAFFEKSRTPFED